MSNALTRIFNKAMGITPVNNDGITSQVNQATPNKRTIKNPSEYIYRQQLARIKQDILSWRFAVGEVEQPWYPQRIKLQQLFQDTVLNGHVDACMTKRKRLTLLKDFGFFIGGKENEQLTKLFKTTWFEHFMGYVLDARAYGYSLISLGDIEKDKFPNLGIIRRANVSPERLQIQHFFYSITGLDFTDPNTVDDFGNKVADWTAWVTTPSESGNNKCGNGYLYKVGLYEIFLRNVLGYNGDFVELYSQPYRVGKTNKMEGDERDELEKALRDMGSSGYAIIDPVDEIEFLETALGGTGYKGYESLEKRCEEKVSKIILGHASAIDKTTGQLGNSEEVKEAIKEVQQEDNKFFANYMNEVMIDKFRNLGFNIPFGTEFVFKNDAEKQEHIKAENDSNLQVANVAKTMKEAGMKMDETYFVERTGIKFTEIEEPKPTNIAPKFGTKVQDSLKKLYGKKD
jgi:phage gp29-like protein